MTSNPPVAAMMIMAAMAACVSAVFLFVLPQEGVAEPTSMVYEHREAADTWRLLQGPGDIEWRGEPGVRYGEGRATGSSAAVPTQWTPAEWPTGTRLRFCADGVALAWSFEVRGEGAQQRFVYAAVAPCL